MPLPYALSRRRTINVEILISSRQKALPHHHARHLLDHRLVDCRNNDGCHHQCGPTAVCEWKLHCSCAGAASLADALPGFNTVQQRVEPWRSVDGILVRNVGVASARSMLEGQLLFRFD